MKTISQGVGRSLPTMFKKIRKFVKLNFNKQGLRDFKGASEQGIGINTYRILKKLEK